MGSKSGLVGRPGQVPLTGRRQEFARLIARGVSNSEACRMVGVNRRTGTRWRYGRTVTEYDNPIGPHCPASGFVAGPVGCGW